jgi:hypothetical protein
MSWAGDPPDRGVPIMLRPASPDAKAYGRVCGSVADRPGESAPLPKLGG